MPTNILLAEDSPAMRAFLVSAIDGLEDVEVIEASSGFEALKLLPRRQFSLIITDINMPDINGLELINFVRQNDAYKNIPLIVVTTKGRERDRDKGIALGANEYLVKPIDPDHFVEVVKKYIKQV